MADSEQQENKVTIFEGKVSDLAGGGAVADRLLTTLERAFGLLFGPLLEKYSSSFRRREAESWIKRLESLGLPVDGVELTLGQQASLVVRATREERKLNNELAIASLAIDEVMALQGESSVPDPLPDIELEWFDQFWDLAGNISSEERQAVWGKVLARKVAGEQFSVRALHFLSTLAGEEAKQIEYLAACAYTRTINSRADIGIVREFKGTLGSDAVKNRERIAELKMINDRLVDHFRSVDLHLHVSIGVFYQDGWAHSMLVQPNGDGADVRIANRKFRIDGDRAKFEPDEYDLHGFVGIGSGYGITPLGAEILSVIRAEPDEEYVHLFAAAIDKRGWRLLREDGSIVVPWDDSYA